MNIFFRVHQHFPFIHQHFPLRHSTSSIFNHAHRHLQIYPPPPITHTRIHWTKLENTGDEHLLSGSPTFPFHSPTFPFETFNILHLQPRSPSLTNLPTPHHTHTYPLNEIREHWGWTSSFGFTNISLSFTNISLRDIQHPPSSTTLTVTYQFTPPPPSHTHASIERN